MKQYARQIAVVGEELGSARVTELERLATALFVTRRELLDSSVETRSKRINELKPHITVNEAREALIEVDRFIKQAETVRVKEV
jgi:16S rRNA A1518/A1519 N6-dimethyltransferase RsmA/KsgA/DIM1 with predicted DNA glycosylase/AP lyase activity